MCECVYGCGCTFFKVLYRCIYICKSVYTSVCTRGWYDVYEFMRMCVSVCTRLRVHIYASGYTCFEVYKPRGREPAKLYAHSLQFSLPEARLHWKLYNCETLNTNHTFLFTTREQLKGHKRKCVYIYTFPFFMRFFFFYSLSLSSSFSFSLFFLFLASVSDCLMNSLCRMKRGICAKRHRLKIDFSL